MEWYVHKLNNCYVNITSLTVNIFNTPQRVRTSTCRSLTWSHKSSKLSKLHF